MSNIAMPSLSPDGWCFSAAKTADYLLSHFFLSDYSQTYMYLGSVSSLPWILTENQGDMTATTISTQKTLSEYFSRYFTDVIVEVTEVPNEEEPSKAQISLYVKFTDSEGKEHVVGRMLSINDTIIEKIIAVNNG